MKVFWTTFNQNIGRVEQICVNVAGDDFFVAVEDNFGLWIGRGAETDNHAMNMRLLSGFAVPNERSVREIDMIFRREDIFPKRGDGFALRNGISSDKSGAAGRIAHKISGFHVPGGNVVEILDFGENFLHIGFLRGILISETDERRVADDKIGLRTNFLPISLQSVGFDDVRVGFQRQKVQIAVNNLLSLLNHLQFGNPKGSLSDCDGKIVNFDAEKLIDRNFYRVDEFAELNLGAEKFFKDFVFQSAQGQITFRQKIT